MKCACNIALSVAAACFVLLGVFFLGNPGDSTSLTGQMLEAAERTFGTQENLVAEIPVDRMEEKPSQSVCSFDSQQEPLHGIVFSEIAWMGTEESPHEEWMRISNRSSEARDVSDWQIIDQDEQIHFFFPSGEALEPGSSVLVRRGEDYTGNLRNADEGLRLFTASCVLQDEVFASPSWPAGEASSRDIMKRSEDLSWYTATEDR